MRHLSIKTIFIGPKGGLYVEVYTNAFLLSNYLGLKKSEFIVVKNDFNCINPVILFLRV